MNKNHNELIKTLSHTANKSVPWSKGTWRITVKDDIALQLSWYSEIRKQHSNYVFTLLTRLIDIPTFDRPVRMPCLLIQTDRNSMKVEQRVSMHSHAFERSYERQIVTDAKSRNASQVIKFPLIITRKVHHKIQKTINEQFLKKFSFHFSMQFTSALSKFTYLME